MSIIEFPLSHFIYLTIYLLVLGTYHVPGAAVNSQNRKYTYPPKQNRKSNSWIQQVYRRDVDQKTEKNNTITTDLEEYGNNWENLQV